ncbi:MAG: glutamate synthase subunit beta [Bacteroidetes bacterium]|nr:glutamate synthase subunit beta [Bacteroidota bacterium]
MSARGFIEFDRVDLPERPVSERLRDHFDVHIPLPIAETEVQAQRCMDCGVPFCQAGCPLSNVIPDFNAAVAESDWEGAYRRLRSTNNFPEFTGRVCPAPCEAACVVGLIDEPVAIELTERAIADEAWRRGFVRPDPPLARSGFRVAVVGSGPAGLACADQLNRAGHSVTVLERNERVGGLLRYGIPDFKLEASVIDRRLELMVDEGVEFRTGVNVGTDVQLDELNAFDAVVLACGATKPRDLDIPGRHLGGVHFAWDFLSQQNKVNAGDKIQEERISAEGKHVVVIGGGDTGSDCVGTANRQGAASVVQFELFPMPAESRAAHQPWPFYPTVLKTTTSHDEGCERLWSTQTVEICGADNVQWLRVLEVAFVRDQRGRTVPHASGRVRTTPADLVLLAIGYTGPESDWLTADLGVQLDERLNILTGRDYRVVADAGAATSSAGLARKLFAAGDARRGQSLVVWAISEGREVARSVDKFLTGSTTLPSRGRDGLPRV